LIGSPAPSAPPPPAPSPQAFQPTDSPLIVPSAPPSSAAPQAPVYPPNYPAPAPAYGTYPAAPGSRQYPYAYGEPRLRGPGAHEHDGFFLRLAVGVGAGGMAYDERTAIGQKRSGVKTRGLIGSFEVAVGGRVVDNLIVHGSLIAVGMSSNKTVDGVENNNYDELATRMGLLGAGVTYYVMPTNLYLTLVAGASYLEERREDERTRGDSAAVESGVGGATALTVGKEWWVGQRGQWAIGAAITGGFYTAPVEIAGEDTWARAHSISLNFSATLN
jgi:hypothetical protein